jgi:hypothetical protein
MSDATSLLDRVTVAKPCPANWDEMTGDDRVRHCAACDLDVYDLSAMRRDEAESFVASRLGRERTCVRFWRRADGRVLTQDCPVGVRAAWRKVTWAAAALLAGGFAAAAMFAPRGADGAPRVAPLKQVYEFVQRYFVVPVPRRVAGEMWVSRPVAPPPVMGDVAPPAKGEMPAPAPNCKPPAPQR